MDGPNLRSWRVVVESSWLRRILASNPVTTHVLDSLVDCSSTPRYADMFPRLQQDAPHLCRTVRSRGCTLPPPQPMAAPRPPATLRATSAAYHAGSSLALASARSADLPLLHPLSSQLQEAQQHRQTEQQDVSSSAGARDEHWSGMGTGYALPQVEHDTSLWQQYKGTQRRAHRLQMHDGLAAALTSSAAH